MNMLAEYNLKQQQKTEEHDEECHCAYCETCFHCEKTLEKKHNDCKHCLNKNDI